MRPKGKPSELEARRLEAIALLSEGKKSSEVARMLGASASSVKRWKDALRQGGPDALKAKRHPGRTPRMTKAQKAELNLLLACGPRAAGFESDYWTSPQARDLILRNFGIEFHVGYVWQILRDLGWSKPATLVSAGASANGDELGERISSGRANGGAVNSIRVAPLPAPHAAPAPQHQLAGSYV